MSRIEFLPKELLDCVLGHVDARGLLRLGSCSRTMSDRIRSDPGWSLGTFLKGTFRDADAFLHLLREVKGSLSGPMLTCFVRRQVFAADEAIPSLVLSVPLVRQAEFDPGDLFIVRPLVEDFLCREGFDCSQLESVQYPRYRYGHVPSTKRWFLRDSSRTFAVDFCFRRAAATSTVATTLEFPVVVMFSRDRYSLTFEDTVGDASPESSRAPRVVLEGGQDGYMHTRNLALPRQDCFCCDRDDQVSPEVSLVN